MPLYRSRNDCAIAARASRNNYDTRATTASIIARVRNHTALPNITTRMMIRCMKRICFALVVSGTLLGCGDDGGHDHDVDASVEDITVQLAFAAKVNGTPFTCGQAYNGIGTAASAYTGTDFRYYVSDVKLVMTGDHTESVPVVLEANAFQSDGVALLDFETGGTGCQQGSPETHTSITGTVPAAPSGSAYTGIEFTVGVPLAKNHLDVAAATPPLDVPAMYWAWSSGYKFLKLDGTVGGQGFNLHLGSTGCDAMGTTPSTTCANSNRMTISLTGYTPSTSVVVADVAHVLDGVDVTINTTNTAPGCMSFPNDPECMPVFPKLGLAYGAAAASTQTLFSVE